MAGGSSNAPRSTETSLVITELLGWGGGIVADERALLERYVQMGKLMQLTTLSEDGSPALCHVWYLSKFDPDRLYFISRKDRVHSTNLRRDPRVAGGVVAIPLTGLGQVVRGVTFKGTASQVADEHCRSALADFIGHWPKAGSVITYDRLVAGETLSRLYEVAVTDWLLFDEEYFPDSPRRAVKAR